MENSEGDHVAKRQKTSSLQRKQTTIRNSRIFTPFRTVGLVSSTVVPFTSLPLGKTTFQITTSIGRCIQTYDVKRGLNLVFLSRPQTPATITATLAYKDRVLTAWGESNSLPGIWTFKRGKKLTEIEMPKGLQEPIQQLLVFGSWLIGRCRTRIEVWKNSTYEHYTTLYPASSGHGNDELTTMCNMPTYLNKIFVGHKNGSVDIWNVSTGKLIYNIFPPSPDAGAVTAMQSTPALSLLAIAYSNGPLIIHDIRKDQTQILLNSETTIVSISFRTDGQGAGEDGREAGVMATAGPETGDVTFWDLNKGGRVMGVLRGAHNPPSAAVDDLVSGGINKIEFLTGQPVLVTSGLDNCLKTWIFDETPFSPIPRILHSRSGHAAPITRLQFLPSDADGVDAGGKWLLSAGKDRSLWGWSLRKDGQSTELSQGNIRKKAKKLGILGGITLASGPTTSLEDLKAPEITCIASSLNRDGGMGAFAGDGGIWQKGGSGKKLTDAQKSGTTGWESVVTGHKGDHYARTWFWGRKKAGRWMLGTGDSTSVSAVAMSPCGTFAVVGSEAGGIDSYNLQSGLHRQRFPAKLTPAEARKLKIAQIEGLSTRKFPAGMGRHTRAVTGIIVDSLNRNIISCSMDGRIKFWDFKTGALVDEIDWYPSSGIIAMKYHASTDLIALACDDLSIRVVDIVTKKTIREFWGCKDGINDFCFSNDGRWIIAASNDSIVRVWDLPTGHLIDAIRMPRACTALAFSGTGEFLATACEGEIGVNIWNNKTLFTHMPTRHISETEITEMNLPTASGEGGLGLMESAMADDDEDTEDSAPVLSLEQLNKDMMTLSVVPKSRWQTLLNLDLIKQRNKPTEAPKAAEKAPFFLPSLENPMPTIPIPTDDISEPLSRITKMDRTTTSSQFTQLLLAAHRNSDYTPFITHLKGLSPSAADLEIRSLSQEPGSSELIAFVQALASRLREKRDYELVQAWMTVFLRLHGGSVVGDERLRSSLQEWRREQESEVKRLGQLVGYTSGVIGFLRSPRV